MQVQARKDQIYRIRPRHNADVNGYWACDEGRVNYKFVNADRIRTSFFRHRGETFDCSREEAITQIRTALGYAPSGAVEAPARVKSVVLLSATCTLEEMFLFGRLAQDRLGAPVFVARHVPDGVDDALLRRADKHPNAKGAELLGLRVLDLQRNGGDSDAVINALGPDGVLIAVGFNTDVSPALDSIVSRARTIIALSACRTSLTERADIVIAGLTFAEKDGLVVNFEGHVQQLRPAIDPMNDTEWRIADALAASLTGAPTHELAGTRAQSHHGYRARVRGRRFDQAGVDGRARCRAAGRVIERRPPIAREHECRTGSTFSSSAARPFSSGALP